VSVEEVVASFKRRIEVCGREGLFFISNGPEGVRQGVMHV